MFGQDKIYTALNVSSITGLLDDYRTGKALFSESVMPEDFTGQKSVNYYMVSSFNGGLEYSEYRYSISCRAATQGEASTIASAVFDALNRSSYGDYYIVCSVNPVIPPADDTDNFNVPVEIILKTR